MKRAIRRQSPALILAVIALIAALSGTALAGGFITKKKAKKVADAQITKRAPGLSVAHASTAGRADTAGVADKVGPLSAGKFDYRASIGAGRTTIGTFGNLVITGTCVNNAATPETLGEASSTVNDAMFKSEGIDEGEVVHEFSSDDVDPGDFPDINSQGTESSGTLSFLTPGGSVATATWANEDNESGPFGDCQFWGTVFNS